MQPVKQESPTQKEQMSYQNGNVALLVIIDTIKDELKPWHFDEARETHYGVNGVEISLEYTITPNQRQCSELGLLWDQKDPISVILAKGSGKGKDEMLAEIEAKKAFFLDLVNTVLRLGAENDRLRDQLREQPVAPIVQE